MRRFFLAALLCAAPALAQDSLLSALPNDSSIDGTEELYCEDSGNTTASMCVVQDLFDALGGGASGTDDWEHNTTYDLHYTDRDGGNDWDLDSSEFLFLPSPRYGFYEYTDFFERSFTALSNIGSPFAYIVTTGSCSGDVAVASATHPGIASCTTSTSTAGRSGFFLTPNSFLFGGGIMVAECLVYIPALSSVAQSFGVNCGFSDSNGGTGLPTDGAFLFYNHGTNSGNWYGYNCNNTTCVGVDTTVAVAATTWYRLTTIVNADGTSASFCVNGACVTNSNTLPTAAGREFGFAASIVKSGGSSARELYLDYVWVWGVLTTPR